MTTEENEVLRLAEIEALGGMIVKYKAREDEFKALRIEAEKRLEELMGEETRGTSTIGRLKITVTRRKNVTIDDEILRAQAYRFGIERHLGTLFRWKPSIVKKEWDACPDNIKAPLLAAITEKDGKPSFSISIDENFQPKNEEK